MAFLFCVLFFGAPFAAAGACILAASALMFGDRE
jgi:hypothetical protein